MIAESARGRRAGAARREARRHRLDHPGVRRRLPRPDLAAGRRRDHRQPLPRLRLARPDGRHRAQARRRRVRARADLQQGGAEVQHATHRRTASWSAAGCSTTCAALNAGAEPLGSFGAVDRRDHRPEPGIDLDFNGPILAPGLRRPGRHRRRHPAGSSAPPRGTSSPARRARCCGSGPTRGAMRDAAPRAQRRAARPDAGEPDTRPNRVAVVLLATLAVHPGRLRRRRRPVRDLLRGGREAATGPVRGPRRGRRRPALIEALPELPRPRGQGARRHPRRVEHRHLRGSATWSQRARGRRRRPGDVRPGATARRASPARRRTRSTRPLRHWSLREMSAGPERRRAAGPRRLPDTTAVG